MSILIEREDHLKMLADLWHSVHDHGGHIALVYGEAGIGKSSLVERFLSDIKDGSLKAIGLCDPLNTPIPMGAVLEISHKLLTKQNLNPTHQNEEQPAVLLYEQLSSATAPVVVVIEDAHWADQGTLDWLKFIGRRIRALPMLLIVTYRDDEVTPSHPLRSAIGQIPSHYIERIALQPLSAQGIQAWDIPDHTTAEKLLEITGGNPFFLTEILNDSQFASCDSVPASVVDAVNARLNRLDPALQHFIEMICCNPATIRTEMLNSLFGDAYLEYLVESTRLQLLVATRGHFRFRHELARLATYTRLSASERQSAHSRLLACLLQESSNKRSIDEIVHHALGAQDPQYILEFAPLAAREAARMGAHREAEKYLSAALEYIDHAEPEMAAIIHEEWAYEAGLSLQIDEAVIEARRMAITLWKTLGRMDKVGENLRALSRLHWYRGEAIKASRYAQDAVSVLENEAPSEGKAMAYAVRAQFHMLQDRMTEAIEWGTKSLDMARQVRAHEVIAHALNTIGTAQLFRGNLEGETCLRQSLEIALQYHLHEQAARVYTNLSECMIEARQLDKAEKLIKEGIAFDMEHELDSWTYYLIGRHAQLRLEQDQYAEALEIANGALAQDNQTLLMQLPARIARSRALLRTAHPDAMAAIKQVNEHALQVDEPQYTAVVRATQLEAAFLFNDQTLAAHYYEDVIKIGPSRLSMAKWADILFWAYLSGVATFSDEGRPLPEALNLLLSGQYAAAAASFNTGDAGYQSAWCRWLEGTEQSITTANNYFIKTNAIQAKHYLHQQIKQRNLNITLESVRRGPNSYTRSHPYGLTRKEQIVLGRLIDGASNAAIANDLSRSVRTIENHVSSILTKLSAKNRAEVIVRIQGEPWLLNKDDGTSTANGEHYPS